MLVIILGIVWYTWRWSLLEITLLFLANFIANLFVMIAISNYSRQMNKLWSIYHFCSSSTFTLLWAYWAIFNDQYQYLIFQISFMLAATKAITFYRFQKDLKIVNEKLMVALNIVILIVFIYVFKPETYSIIQWIWFGFVTTGLVSTKDAFRYFMNLIWSLFIIVGSAIVVVWSFTAGNLDWIALGFLLLTLTAVIYFLQLLPWYLVKKKNG